MDVEIDLFLMVLLLFDRHVNNLIFIKHFFIFFRSCNVKVKISFKLNLSIAFVFV